MPDQNHPDLAALDRADREAATKGSSFERVLAETKFARALKNAWRAKRLAQVTSETGGVALIRAERQRQIEVEGWTAEHDDTHTRGQMAGAAACYALYRSHIEPEMSMDALKTAWPWDGGWWNPKDRRADLVRAGALIAAEIDRLDRAEIPNATERK